VDVRVQVAGEATHRAQAVHDEPSARRIVDVVAHVQVDDLADHEMLGRLPIEMI